MAKVITFSRQFPSYHPRKGEPTYFVEKLLRSIYGTELPRIHQFDGIDRKEKEFILSLQPKHHTIRAGHRFKAGDKFSPRVWSGKPYNSKQIIIAPDMGIKKVWDIVFAPKDEALFINGAQYYPIGYEEVLNELATNDGLNVADLVAWFNKPLTGQIICWNENIRY